MPSIEKKAISFFKPSELYALVTDIKAYPSFFPWCIAAEILKEQGPNHCTAKLAFKKKWFEFSLTTENMMTLNESIVMAQQQGPFKRFNASWKFHNMDGGAEVVFVLNFELLPGLDKLLGSGVHKIFSEVMASFLKEAEKRYG